MFQPHYNMIGRPPLRFTTDYAMCHAKFKIPCTVSLCIGTGVYVGTVIKLLYKQNAVPIYVYNIYIILQQLIRNLLPILRASENVFSRPRANGIGSPKYSR